MLGFSPNTVISITSTAERAVDLEHGFHDLYVYCDIVQSQYVGDALVPLLRIVPVEGKVSCKAWYLGINLVGVDIFISF